MKKRTWNWALIESIFHGIFYGILLASTFSVPNPSITYRDLISISGLTVKILFGFIDINSNYQSFHPPQKGRPNALFSPTKTRLRK